MKRERSHEARLPIIEVLEDASERGAAGDAGARCAENGSFYIYSVFMLVYATQHSHIDRSVVLNGIMLASACELHRHPRLRGALGSDWPQPVYMFGAVMTASSRTRCSGSSTRARPRLATLALLLTFLCSHAPMYAPQGAFFSELFGTSVRYSGASLGAQLSAAVAGGFSPLIATFLLPRYGRSAIALYIIFMAFITIVAVLSAAETLRRDIET